VVVKLADFFRCTDPGIPLSAAPVYGPDRHGLCRVMWAGVIGEARGWWWAIVEIDGTMLAGAFERGNTTDRNREVARRLARLVRDRSEARAC
jgi:hypothetical protein